MRGTQAFSDNGIGSETATAATRRADYATVRGDGDERGDGGETVQMRRNYIAFAGCRCTKVSQRANKKPSWQSPNRGTHQLERESCLLPTGEGEREREREAGGRKGGRERATVISRYLASPRAIRCHPLAFLVGAQ